jgi:hypothetical protein
MLVLLRVVSKFRHILCCRLRRCALWHPLQLLKHLPPLFFLAKNFLPQLLRKILSILVFTKICLGTFFLVRARFFRRERHWKLS